MNFFRLLDAGRQEFEYQLIKFCQAIAGKNLNISWLNFVRLLQARQEFGNQLIHLCFIFISLVNLSMGPSIWKLKYLAKLNIIISLSLRYPPNWTKIEWLLRIQTFLTHVQCFGILRKPCFKVWYLIYLCMFLILIRFVEKKSFVVVKRNPVLYCTMNKNIGLTDMYCVDFYSMVIIWYNYQCQFIKSLLEKFLSNKDTKK